MGRGFIRTFAIVGTLALGVTASPWTAVGAGAAAAPSLTVTPRTGLADHGVVQVGGTGFTPDELGSVQQCAPALGACLGFSVDAEVDEVGAFSASYEVRRFITWFDGPPIDCAVIECRIVVEQVDSEVRKSRILTFDSAAPFDPLPTVTVDPDTNLSFTQVATLTGMHFQAGEEAGAFECASIAEPRCVRIATLTADTMGVARGTVTLQRVLRTFGGVETDCADVTVTCSVALNGFDSTLRAATPISFDTSSPLPTMVVEPAGLLPYRSLVTVVGHHLRPSTSYTAKQCYPGVPCGEAAQGTSDATGELRLTVAARRFGFGINELGAIPVDCASPKSCPLMLSVTDTPAEELRANISFDPAAPVPPPPTLAVTPATDLPFQATVRVTGSGFLPNTGVSLAECTKVALFAPCTKTTKTTADAAGHIDVEIPVQRVLSDGLTPTDCADAASRCIVRSAPTASPWDLREFGSALVSFDPASAPPGPAATVTPATDLTDGQTVSVTGSGFAPSTQIGLLMCKAGAAFSLLDCEITNPTWFINDTTGGFTHNYDVRAHLSTGHGPVDCSAAPGTCALAAVRTSDYSQFTLVPVSFVPETGPTPIVTSRSRRITEPTGADHNTKVELRLSEPTDHTVKVTWQTVDGTAHHRADFALVYSEATFLPGETSIIVRVPVHGDPYDEPDETFRIGMFGASGATMGTEGIVTILDDDRRPRLSIEDSTVSEDGGTASVRVSLSQRSERNVWVEYGTHHTTAHSTSDYACTTGRLLIAPGQTSGRITIPIVDDRHAEPSETLRITLHDAHGATIRDDTGILTITDDD